MASAAVQLSLTVKTKGKVSVKCSRDLACCQASSLQLLQALLQMQWIMVCALTYSRNDNLLANVATAVVKGQPVLMCQL